MYITGRYAGMNGFETNCTFRIGQVESFPHYVDSICFIRIYEVDINYERSKGLRRFSGLSRFPFFPCSAFCLYIITHKFEASVVRKSHNLKVVTSILTRANILVSLVTQWKYKFIFIELSHLSTFPSYLSFQIAC